MLVTKTGPVASVVTMANTKLPTVNAPSRPTTAMLAIPFWRRAAVRISRNSIRTVRSSNTLETKSMEHVMIVTPAGCNPPQPSRAVVRHGALRVVRGQVYQLAIGALILAGWFVGLAGA